MNIEVTKEELMVLMDCVVTVDVNQYNSRLVISNQRRKELNNFDLSGLYMRLEYINQMDNHLEGPKLRKSYKALADSIRETKLGLMIIRFIEWMNKL